MDENLNDTTSQETTNVIEAEIQEEIVIEIDESMGWVMGDRSLHYSMAGRDEDNQHPISAITGLRHELDQIEALHPVTSNKIGVANYYEWHDDKHSETGYFVTIEPGTSTIKICDGSNIFGVVVDAAGFIGGQGGITLDYVNGATNTYVAVRDNSYGLVITSGLVSVRCESNVVTGDRVVSNAYGIATKTDSGCGYQVVAIEDKNGVNYASIALGVQACTTDLIGKNLQYLDGRMNDAEANIAVATNAANQAYNKAVQSNAVSEDAVLKALEAINKSDVAVSATDAMNNTISSVRKTAEQAKTIAEGAVSAANEIRKEAETTANNALSNVNNLIEKFEPIDEWIDPATGQVGAEYIITYMDNQGLATKAEVQTVESLTEDNKSLIEKNVQNITMLVSSVDKYSVGEYSQAYGLTLEQAQNILKKGMIYIPTKHGSMLTHTEDYEGSPTRYFTNGYYYEWAELEDGSITWSEGIGKVWFGTEQPAGDAYSYWYNVDTLYILSGGEWIEAATIAGNINNRITSMIRQDVNEVAVEIVNARGDAASLGLAMDEISSKIGLVVTKNDEGEDVPNVASFFLEANKEGSTATLNADKIVMTGDVAFVSADDLGANGATIIDGQKVFTGLLQSLNYKDDNDTVYSDEGTLINLNDGAITSKNFAIDADGNAYISGRVHASSGKIADCEITEAVIDAEGNVVKPSQLTVPFANITGRMTFYEGDIYDEYGNKNTEEYYLQAEPTEEHPCYIYFPGFKISDDGVEIDAANIVDLTVDAAMIRGELTADQINGAGLNVTNATISNCTITKECTIEGTFTANQIDVTNGKINAGQIDVADVIVTGSAEIKSIVANTIDADFVNALEITANGVYIQGENNYSSFFSSAGWEICDYSMYYGSEEYGSMEASISLDGGDMGAYFSKSGKSVGIGFNSDGTGTFVGSWTSPSAVSTTSDATLKNTIMDLNDKYSVFFNNLSPCTYKYNDGTSNRLHIGFIAQEVKNAIDVAGLTTTDFAGYVVRTEKDSVTGEDKQIQCLRYDEFIALNTNEIQKLKARVAELEEIIVRGVNNET